MSSIRCVLLDMDGVLADYDRDVRIETLARLAGSTPAAVRSAIYGSGIEEAGDAGTLDAQAYLDALSRELGVPITVANWTAARRAATRVRTDTLALVEALEDQVTLGLLTNNGWLMAQQLPAIAPALFPLFAGRSFCAAQFGAAKPAPAAYQGCLAMLGARPAETLFVDDSATNVTGALAAGLQGHHFVDLVQFRRLLVEHGLRVD